MTDYASNSHRSKHQDQKEPSRDRKKVEKVVTGTVKTKKKSGLRKFTDLFISEDVNSVKSYIFMDVLIPAITDAIEDIVTNGIRMILRGETGGSKKSSTSKISYRSYYDRSNDRRSDEPRVKMGYGYDDIILDSYGEADEVLMKMEELIATYGLVSVADFYDLVGVKGSYTDNKYGWTNIRTAQPVRVRDGGYVLKLPKALPLD